MSVQNSFTNPAFKGVYKVTMPNVKNVANENEKNAVAEAIVNTSVMGINMSAAEPKISNDNNSVYFKVDDKNNSAFEAGFKNILDDCNKRFNTDLAQKVYCTKVDENEYNKANPLK